MAPVKGLKLSPGNHEIKIDKDESRRIPKTYTATVASGDTLNLFQLTNAPAQYKMPPDNDFSRYLLKAFVLFGSIL